MNGNRFLMTSVVGLLALVTGCQKSPPPAKAVATAPGVQPPGPAESAATPEAIHAEMKKLAKWSEFSAYANYFVLFPRVSKTVGEPGQLLDLRTRFSGEVQGLMTAKVKEVNPYYDGWKESGDGEKLLRIRLTVPDSFAKSPDLANRDKLSVVLDHAGEIIPAPAAEVMAVGFRQGFITRVVLGHYVQAWDQHAPGIIKTEEVNFASGWKYTDNDKVSLRKFSNVNLYFLPKGKGKALNFDGGLTELLRTQNLQLRGIMLGWQAASLLAPERQDGPEQKAAIELIRLTTTPDEVGELTAYTLHYLSGYFQIVDERERNPAQRLTTNADIASRLVSEEAAKKAKDARKVFHQFAELLVDEHHAIASGDTLGDRKGELLQRHTLFLKGFVRGSMKAADELASLGYKVGYEDGFRDGYSRGYADGHRDGHTQGQASASGRGRGLFGSIARLFSDNRGKIGEFLKRTGERAASSLLTKVLGG